MNSFLIVFSDFNQIRGRNIKFLITKHQTNCKKKSSQGPTLYLSTFRCCWKRLTLLRIGFDLSLDFSILKTNWIPKGPKIFRILVRTIFWL